VVIFLIFAFFLSVTYITSNKLFAVFFIYYLIICPMLCYSNGTDNNRYILRLYCVVAGSCRPFQRLSQIQHEYEGLHKCELLRLVVFHGFVYNFPIGKFSATSLNFPTPKTTPLVQTSCIYLQQCCNGARGCNAIIFQKCSSTPEKQRVSCPHAWGEG